MKFHKLLVGTSQAHFKKSTSQFAALGLSSGQPKILETLVQEGSCMQKDLAKACHVEPATITNILPAMEKKGLITRNRITSDTGKRSLYVKVTKKGEELEKKIAQIFDEVETTCFEDFTAAEKETFITLLERLHRNIKGD